MAPPLGSLPWFLQFLSAQCSHSVLQVLPCQDQLLHCLAKCLVPVTRSLQACVLSHFSQVRPFVTLWTVAHQAPLSMGFFRQEYWSGLPRTPPGDLPDPRIEPESPASPALQVDS